ncbi:MAG: hypothetical protein KOO63_06505 [Bacteroidales bacterium]|nr:hypothetical protein [Candidatus Latescibacterota bacterium]
MRKSEKRPVLTSPWKIGMFVALMLVVTSFGVGYYLVNVYDINLTWLNTTDSKWVIDSFGFFKEMYPMVAGVILIALVAYFTIASAVRRYKFYLSSGQDYRKMISLADSIDDLTNPAQIAKLSDYPELQGILRNYGDQIKEISEELSSRVEESRSVDLEIELDSVLSGNGINEPLIEGKWWGSIIRKVADHVAGSKSNKDGKSDAGRQVIARAALSFGKWMESLGGSNEDIIEIARAVGSLNSTVKELESAEPATQAVQAPDGGKTQAVADIRDALANLDSGSRAMNEFSEENNGLALNIALMAARGDISEQDLARFAEKVRSTAERFNKLGVQISDTSRKIDSGLQTLSSGAVSSAASSPDTSGITESLSEISKLIEEKSHSLQAKVTSLGNEIDTFNEEIHKTLADDRIDDDLEDDFVVETNESSKSSGEFVSFDNGVEESAENQDESDELVLDRSNIWEAESFTSAGSDDVHQAIFDEPVNEGTESHEEDTDSKKITIEDAENVEPEKVPEVKEHEVSAEQADGPQPGDDMMEMPGHRWVKIGMDEESDSHEVPPAVELAREDSQETVAEEQPDTEVAGQSANDDSPEDMMERMAETIRGAADMNRDQATQKDEETPASENDNNEPVYDLFELGAIEYVEQTPSQ